MRVVGPVVGPVLVALPAVLAAGPASAHLVGIEFGGFYAGAMHVATVPAGLALMAGLAVIAAGQARENARWMLATLPLGLMLGALAGTSWDAAAALAPWLWPLSAAGIAIAGALAILSRPLPAVVLGALAGLFGLAMGIDNGLAAQGSDVPVWLYTAGVVAAGTVIGTLAVAALTAVLPAWPWKRLAGRVAGSWLAAIGLVSFGAALAT
ncbi:MAG: HupE/UreJ family protein [Pseudomonadota bacterium]